MSTEPVTQLALDETQMSNDALEAMLERRAELVIERRALNATFREADTKVRGAVEVLEWPESGAIRIGRFRLTKTSTPARHVEFDTEAGERISIADDNEE